MFRYRKSVNEFREHNSSILLFIFNFLDIKRDLFYLYRQNFTQAANVWDANIG